MTAVAVALAFAAGWWLRRVRDQGRRRRIEDALLAEYDRFLKRQRPIMEHWS